MLEKILIPGGRLELNEVLNEQTRRPDVYISQIYDVQEDDKSVTVAMPIKEGRLIPLSVGMHFDAYFYTKIGLYHSMVVVIDRYKSSNLYMLVIELQTVLQKVQRRQFFRYATTIPIGYAVMDEEAIHLVETLKVLPDKLLRGRLLRGTTLDISGGGVRFAGIRLERDEKIYVEFNYTFHNSIRCFKGIANVIGSEYPQNRTDICHNRAGFEVVNSDDRETLIKYIFEQERKARRNERGGYDLYGKKNFDN